MSFWCLPELLRFCDSALAPVFDMGNHNPLDSVAPVVIPTELSTGDLQGTVYYVTSKSHEAGDELHLSYGALSVRWHQLLPMVCLVPSTCHTTQHAEARGCTPPRCCCSPELGVRSR